MAAHEVGHAVQHAEAYQWLTMRSQLVPIVQVSSRLSTWIVIIGIALSLGRKLLRVLIALLGLGLMAIATVFSFITLPVEYDASRRALAWLTGEMLTDQEYDGAQDASEMGREDLSSRGARRFGFASLLGDAGDAL